MPTGLIYDDRFLEHDTGPDHPERPERLRAIVDRLKATHLWDQLVHLPVVPAPLASVERAHERAYVERLREACELGRPYIDAPDSTISRASYDVALLAAGGVLEAVDAVARKRVRNAFCAVRPPGHHCESNRSMGFCLLNNIAIAAHHILAEHKLSRVAIVDFDVHHGNGTQQIFEHDHRVLFISIHEHPMHLYPGSGYVHESGVHAGEGYTLNVPLDPGSGDGVYRRALLTQATPALEKFGPEMLLISAGFDACRGDPLAHMQVTPEGFAWMTRHLKTLAERMCGGRVVSVLEGGYDLRNLAECVTLHVQALMSDEGHDPMMAMKAGV